MIDIQYIRENSDLVKEKSQQKGYSVDIDKLLSYYEQRKQLLSDIQVLQQQRNELAQSGRQGQPSLEQIEKGRSLKEDIAKKEAELAPINEIYQKILEQVPNMPLETVPVGLSEDENQVVKTVGKPKEFSFTPKSDAEIGLLHDTIDKERAAKVATSRFTYLKGGIVRLQFAIIQFVFDVLGDEKLIQKLINENNLNVKSEAFIPVLPPAMVNTTAYVASARLDAQETTYKLADDDLWMNASAEHSLCTMYMNETLDEAQLPIRYIGYATSFRREAGSYGKDTEGIFRMHQFDKLEMEVFSSPETGLQEHQLLVAIQQYLVQQLGLPYQLIQKCTADIGKPNAQGVDINTWMPAQGAYRETHTADYMTDYQARRLNTKVRRKDGAVEFVHTNDATAFALGRILKAIVENYQNEDGTITVPEVLKPYMGAVS